MIPFEEIDKRLDAIGKTRAWLAETTKRSPGSIRAALAPNAVPKQRTSLLQKALSDAIEKEAEAQIKSPALPDRINIEASPAEVQCWEQAAKADGKTLREWILSKIMKAAAAEKALASDSTKSPANLIELPFLGAVAAGEPVSAPRNETLPVPREYPAGHFIVEINGRSGEPKFMDGDRWVIDGRDCFTPKAGKPCIVSDSAGSYLKKWNAKRRVFESINPEFNDVIPGAEARLQGYPVEKL